MIPWLSPHHVDFPDVDSALEEPNGLLCAGGDLSVERLRHAYTHGIFPWFSDGEPILWWSPDPRLILTPDAFKFRRSLKKSIRANGLTVTTNQCFDQVMALCSETRQTEGTWIHQDMLEAYRALNASGAGFSAETWQGDRLVGGLYGVKLGSVLFGESMVSCVPDASKAALAHICQEADTHQIQLIDCQVPTSHLLSLGATLVDRNDFMKRVRELTQ